jgi:MFS family permease
MDKRKIKLAIYSFSILMMGVIAIAGGLEVIGTHFGSMDVAQQLIAIPSIPIIIVTLLVGKLQEYVSMKKLIIIGILCYLVGGVAPTFMGSFTAILVMRCIFGVGVGIVQALSSALVGAYFDGEERQQVMGRQTSAQMLGAAVALLISGYLALAGWNITFLIHLIAIISLICVILYLPETPPQRQSRRVTTEKPQLTSGAIGWAATIFVFFLGGMILAQFMAFFIASHQLGTSAEAGLATMIFAIGGFLMGMVYGKLVQAAKNYTFIAGLLMGVVAYLLVAFAPNLIVAYIGSLIYGFCVSTIMATVMVGTAASVTPVTIPLAISIATCGQNLGSYLCPMITNAMAGLLGSDISRNAFIFGAILFAAMAVVALIWGATRKETAAANRAA